MSYYAPTSLVEKVWKVVQLYAYTFVCSLSPLKTKLPSSHISVLMVVPRLDRTGGLERQVLQLSKHLADSGGLINILTDSAEGLPARDYQKGFVINRLSAATASSILLHVFSLAMFLFRRRKRYRVVHAHGISGLPIFCMRLASLFGIPSILKIATEHDLRKILSIRSIKHRIYRRWILRATCFVAITQEIRKEMREFGISQDRIRSISNSVDRAIFYPSPSKRGFVRDKNAAGEETTVFLHLGRLEARKGTDILLTAWASMKTGILWIVGNGPEQDKLKEMSARLDLRNVVFFDSTATPSDFYQSADVFVLPSVREGMPAVLLEAMACGLPCIASRIGGVIDVMQDQSEGLLVAPSSSSELHAAMSRLANDPEARRRMGRQALLASEKYDAASITACYSELYRELLGAR